MDYLLFEDYIMLQSLLKDLKIVSSGGAVKQYLTDFTVNVNGEKESRRGRKLRIGDVVDIVSINQKINICKPSKEQIDNYLIEKEEKERVSQLVKELNKPLKKSVKQPKHKKPVKFPGT